MSTGRELLTVYLKGFAMGAADAVPGVSGGTIALITGIYDRLVGAIASLDLEGGVALLREGLRPWDPAARRDALARASRMDLPFLLVLGVGVVSAALTAANVIEWAVGAYAGPTYAFFFGLIAASVVVLRDEMVLDSARGWLVAAAGFALAFVVSGSVDGAIGNGPIVLFLSGAIAICAMVLPGISGSLILLTIGQYETIVGAVHDLTRAAFAGTLQAAVPPFTTLVVFALGALVGILSFARVVAWALERYRVETLTFLVALMIGALRAPAERVLAATPTWTPTVTVVLLGVAGLGAVAVLGLDAMTDEISY
ncbi:MAG: DUF368 domain-containing protein [Halanaeroarchaeum sp.]